MNYNEMKIEFNTTNIFDQFNNMGNNMSEDEYEGAIKAYINSVDYKDIHILLVEDDFVNQILVTELLGIIGIHRVDVAGNGLEALEILKSTLFDLIITDIKMPFMDGKELAEIIRKNDRFNHVPLIAMTSDVMEEQVREYKRIGIDACIAKPVDIMDLIRLFKIMIKNEGIY